jgi:cytochrome c oxidase subunit III
LASVAPLAEQFVDSEQQRVADSLGMWAFLGSEIMLFGGFFFALMFYRLGFPEAGQEASQHFSWKLGGINTAVLLTSSLTMAIAVVTARYGNVRWALRSLLATAVLGFVFLAVKAAEYKLDFSDGIVPSSSLGESLKQPASQIIVNLYYVSTAIHALHLLGGIFLISLLVWRTVRRRLPLPERAITVEMVGLYWHFVDVVWVFLYPTLYLLGR